MTEKTTSNTMGRREFIRAGAIIAGSVALGWRSTESAAAAAPSSPATTIGFWTGDRVATPIGIATNAAALASQTAHLRIHDHFVPATQPASNFGSIIAHFSIVQNNRIVSTPFYAWSSSHPRSRTTAFTMPVLAGHPLSLSLEHASKSQAADSISIPSFKVAGTASLNEGTYILAAGQPDWTACLLIDVDGHKKLVRTSPAGNQNVNFEYVLVTVSRA